MPKKPQWRAWREPGSEAGDGAGSETEKREYLPFVVQPVRVPLWQGKSRGQLQGQTVKAGLQLPKHGESGLGSVNAMAVYGRRAGKGLQGPFRFSSFEISL